MMKMMRRKILMIRTYTELSKLKTFEERFEYLKLDNSVGDETFGSDRYLNQNFYRSREWRQIRDKVIFRDKGCDMGLYGYPIPGRIIIHHMNPVVVKDLINHEDILMELEYLVCVSHDTHNAITFGNSNMLLISRDPIIRTADEIPWRK